MKVDAVVAVPEPLRPWLATGFALLLALAAVWVAMRAYRVLAWRATRAQGVGGLVVRRTHGPLAFVAGLLVLNLVLQGAPDALAGVDRVRHAIGVLLIIAVTVLLLRTVKVTGEAIVARHPYATAADNLRARTLLTQARVLTRTLYGVILLVGLSIALMTFPAVRQVGTSLLASAGIAGLAVGLAAKPVLANLLAGLQLALTQPIRIDDVLVLEGEWGRVEEITGTYVVVAIWDQRRLIVPLQYFIEKPFQNWTRQTSQILGTVLLWVDYRTPVARLRAEVERLCRQDPDWDGRVAIVQVTDVSASAMQLRVLLSSVDSGRSFDLRCRVREALIGLVAREFPEYLPRLRAEIAEAAAPPPVSTAPAPAVSPTPTAPPPG